MLEIPEHYEFGNQMFNANLPWLVPGAIHRLDSWLRPHMRVLEYGSGGSTIFFAARCVSVCSFEHSPEWYAKVNARIRELGLTNVDQRLVENDVECLKQIGELPDAYFDLVLVDGNGIRRGDFAVATLNKLAPGATAVVDNYANHPIAVKAYDGWREEVYDDPKWVGQGTGIFWRP